MAQANQENDINYKVWLPLLVIPFVLLLTVFRGQAAPGEIVIESEEGTVADGATAVEAEGTNPGYVEFATVIDGGGVEIPDEIDFSERQTKTFTPTNPVRSYSQNKGAAVYIEEVTASRYVDPDNPLFFEMILNVDKVADPGDDRRLFLSFRPRAGTIAPSINEETVLNWNQVGRRRVAVEVYNKQVFENPGLYEIDVWIPERGVLPSDSFRFANTGIWDAGSGKHQLGMEIVVTE